MLAVLFAVNYQSIHVFSHKQHLEQKCYSDNYNSEIKKQDKSFAEKEDCPVCDFEFVAFISTNILQFTFFPPFYEIPYQFDSNETCIIFEGNAYYLRGPPTLI
jgi:hypothetical protein